MQFADGSTGLHDADTRSLPSRAATEGRCQRRHRARRVTCHHRNLTRQPTFVAQKRVAPGCETLTCFGNASVIRARPAPFLVSAVSGEFVRPRAPRWPTGLPRGEREGGWRPSFRRVRALLRAQTGEEPRPPCRSPIAGPARRCAESDECLSKPEIASPDRPARTLGSGGETTRQTLKWVRAARPGPVGRPERYGCPRPSGLGNPVGK